MSSLPLPFYDNPILFGRSGRRGLIAFEPAGDGVRVWTRGESGTSVATEPFRPFLLLADRELLAGFTGDARIVALDGDGAYRWLLECRDWSEALQARDHLQAASGRGAGAPDAPYRFFNDPVHQFLLRSGHTSFLGMSFADLRRLALDIEVTTAPGFEFPNAARETDRIVAIALVDSTGFSTVLSGAEMSEADLLRECSRLIRERDPDVIEGHNIFRFDLEYIEARARRHKVTLGWGRGGGAPLRGYAARMQIADRSITYRRYAVSGRHIVDTWLLAQYYDVVSRDLPSYGLKDLAVHFGVAASDRTYLPPEDIPRIFVEDPARLMAYARDDVLETLGLSAILSPPYFVQAQALPFDYQMTVLRGNATKIDRLLLREYLHHGRAVPAPQGGRGVAGGYTAMFQQGVARNVLHVDVASLYPSLMLGQRLFPAADTLGVSEALLADLRTFRLSAKALARDAAPADRALLNGLQQTFKIFINSFYGYLGFSQGHWNDFEAANQVTGEGRRLVTTLVEKLDGLGATVVEVDTDGLYFVPPPDSGPADEGALIAELTSALPIGIQLELDGRYPAMFSYKMKNYVLLDPRGKLVLKGSGLRSRGIELFQRKWMEEMFRLSLTGRRAEIPALVARWEEDFRAHRVPLKEFMKTDTLQESLGAYQEKLRAGQRNASAAYELALRSERPYQPGDQVSYYVSGEGPTDSVNEAAKLATLWDPAAPDENTHYYLGKLRELYDKFRALVEIDGLVPVPPEREVEAPKQLELIFE